MKKYTKPKCRVEWTPPAANERTAFATTARNTRSSVMQSLSQLGCFKAVGAETPKEELSALLEVAAEV